MQQGTIYISGVIGEDTTLLDVIRQVKSQKHVESYLVKIDSVGGYVSEGEAIYQYLKNLDKQVITYATQAYSIASVIFMAGTIRIVPENSENVLMIHLPWMQIEGSHEAITSHLSELKSVENNLVSFYSEALEIDENTIKSLLQNETYLSSKQALELGFATTIQATPKAVAMINNKEEKNESLMDKLTKKMNQILAKLSGAKAELVLQDSTGVELVFPDLEPSDIPAEGEKATVDGKPADGEYLMPDGSSIKVEAGTVTEIMEAEPETDPSAENADEETDSAPADDKMVQLEQRLAALEAKIAELMGESEAENKVLEVVELAAEKVSELENKYQALAKQVGSDFQPNTNKENNTSIKASAQNKTRAWQILNS